MDNMAQEEHLNGTFLKELTQLSILTNINNYKSSLEQDNTYILMSNQN
jgi:hypothetical protein